MHTLKATQTYSNTITHLDENKRLSDIQHAFRKWHNCETHFTTVIDKWAKVLDNQDQVDTFLLYFQKDLDTIRTNSLKVNCLAKE